MIDYHSHILPGIDDGPRDISESVVMARFLAENGIKTVCCTPHFITGCFEASTQEVLSAVTGLQKILNHEDIALEILPGREYYLDEFMESHLKDPLPVGNTKYIMIEVSNNTAEAYIKESCYIIKRTGFIPMIAHPERCRLFAPPAEHKSSRIWSRSRKVANTGKNESALMEYLKDIGCAFQGNLGSFEGVYGAEVKHTANDLKKMGVYTHYGTDAHSLHALHQLKPMFNYLNVKHGI